jgi:rhodanese-related sulfurtransferase
MQNITYTDLINTDTNHWLILDTISIINLQSGIIKNSIYFDIGKMDEYERLGFFNNKSESNKILIISSKPLDSDFILQFKDNGFNSTHHLLYTKNDTLKFFQSNVDLIIDITADEFSLDLKHEQKIINIDLRPENDFITSHVKGAININTDVIQQIKEIFSHQDKLYISSQTGSTSYTLACILRKESFQFIKPVSGGFLEISKLENVRFVKKKNQRKKNI